MTDRELRQLRQEHMRLKQRAARRHRGAYHVRVRRRARRHRSRRPSGEAS
jgi:hypothetical protein